MNYLMTKPEPSIHWTKVHSGSSLLGQVVEVESDFTKIYYLTQNNIQTYIYWNWREEAEARSFLSAIAANS